MDRRVWRLACLVAAGLALALHAHRFDFVADDTFIFLRYARNLIDGQGLVYNPGERVEGYSSPLLTLLVAAGGGGGLDLLRVARALSLVGALATLPLAVWLAQRLTGGQTRLAVLPAFFIAAQAPFACWALAGMDAPLFACGVTATIASLPEAASGPRRRLIVGGLLGLLLLVRAEAWTTAGVVLLALLLRDGVRRCAVTALPALSISGAHLLWRRAYYGDWLPNTYYAKVGHSFEQLGSGLSYVFDYAQGFGGGALLLLPFLPVLWRRDVLWRVTAASAVVLLASVACVGGDGLPMYRFVVPVVPLLAVLWTALLADVWRAARRATESPTRAARVALACAALLIVGLGVRPLSTDPQLATMLDQRDREIPDWTAVGRFLRAYARPGDSVALVPIGAVGYYSRLRVIDMLGLVDRHIAHRAMPPARLRWAGHEKHDGAYVLSREPTFLLLGNVRVLGQELPPRHPRFVRTANPWIEAREGDVYADPERLARDYEPHVARLPGGRYLHFLERRPRPSADGTAPACSASSTSTC